MDEQNSPEDELQLRPYQVHLEEIAIKQNTIVHLPTGSGKTHIALSLIKRFKKDLIKPWGQGGKRTFFLVNTVPLVEQQSKVIAQKCPVNSVGTYSSEDKVDYWDKTKWDMELEKNEVLVMTCEILKLMLQHSYISITDINLLIFDECHHAVDDHPMRQVMKYFEGCPLNQRPRVLGLTATLLNGNVTLGTVDTAIKKLETTFHANIATVNELGEVLEYSTNPNEMIIYYDPPKNTDVIVQVNSIFDNVAVMVMDIKIPNLYNDLKQSLKPGQKDITGDPKKIVKAVKNMVLDMKYLLNAMGVFGGSLGVLAYVILLERLKRKAASKEESMAYQLVLTQITKGRKLLLMAMQNDTGMKKIEKHSSQQIQQLLEILKEYNPSTIKFSTSMKYNIAKKPMSAIVFTQRKFTAKVLYNLLKEVIKADPENYGFLKHEFVVGFNINPFKNTREQYFVKKSNQKAFLKFRNQDLNCLIATNVIEEGVDIPQCLLIVRFDEPLEYRSYIQSKGRARSKESTYVMMINRGDKDRFIKKYQGFQVIENHIQKMLVGHSDNRLMPTDEEIKKELYEDEDIQPYINPYSGTKLSASAAISLLNRYCSILPHDQFTRIIPKWIAEEKKTRKGEVMLLVTITLPIVCPVKEDIKGEPRKLLKAAKRIAALKACIELHKAGELDRESLLPREYAQVNFGTEEVKNCFPNWPWDEKEDSKLPKPGTKKRMRKHEKVYPSCLEGKKDWESDIQTFYLHVINMTIEFKEPKDSRELALYKLLMQTNGYAFLTYKPLPKICQFPMFLQIGEVTINLQENHSELEIDQNRFTLIKQFHHFLFDQILDIAKKFVVYDGGINTLYVVPTIVQNGKHIVDWDTMTTHDSIPPHAPPLPQERRDLKVTRESYQYSVVTPWYRVDLLPSRYIVSNILEYLTPNSPFDDDTYASYQHYYNCKYNLEILGPQDQPLLEVKDIRTRGNCLLPRASTLKTLTDKQKKLIGLAEGDAKMKGIKEVFIPEFCIHYDFPGVLWYKAIMLPSLIHRLTMLLVAEELRSTIARETNLGYESLPPGEKWLPIMTDVHTATKSLLSQVEPPNEIQTIDRINNPINDEDHKPVNIVSMKEAIYELQKKKLSKEFAWDEDKEPLDIERNLTTVTLMDIECYDEFASVVIDDTQKDMPFQLNSPHRMLNTAALPPPPVVYNDKIDLLCHTSGGRGAELRDVAAALTAISSHDAFNLERVETLGDSFLKFISALYLYHKFPKLNEGQLTNIKSRLIGNRNLYYAAERINLGGRMKLDQFSPRNDFTLPSFSIPLKILECIEQSKIRPTFLIGVQVSRSEALAGAIEESTYQRVLERRADPASGVEQEPDEWPQPAMQCYVHKQVARDKTLADGVEALIGTYVQSCGIEGGVRILEWLKVLPPEDNCYNYISKRVETAVTRGYATVDDVNFIMNYTRNDVENILNYKFRDPSLLLEALSHPSYIRNRLTSSYERLEFLGDALLDFLITAHIFEQHQNLNPGELTDLRSALVNNVTFASYTVKLGLQKYLCSQFNPVLDSAIINFVEYQMQRNHVMTEDVLYLIDEEDCKIAEYVEVPKVLSDIFEALAGAIYLDSGGDAAAVWRVYYSIMRRELTEFAANVPWQPVRLLFENIHACPVFGKAQKVDEDIPRMMVPVTVTKAGVQYTVHGFGRNKAQAKRAAAKLALKMLNL